MSNQKSIKFLKQQKSGNWEKEAYTKLKKKQNEEEKNGIYALLHNACILGISLNMYISGMLQIDYLREQLCCMYVIPYYPSLKLSNTKQKTIMLCCNFFFSSKIIFSFLLGIGSYVNHFRNPVKFLSFLVFCVGDLGDSCLQFVE